MPRSASGCSWRPKSCSSAGCFPPTSCCASAPPGEWPHGWLNVTLGTVNTIILALSAITTLLAWVACKTRQFGKFKFFHALHAAAGADVPVHQGYEYHDKWIHYEIKLLPEQSTEALPTATSLKNPRLRPRQEDRHRHHARPHRQATKRCFIDLRAQKNIEQKEINIPRSDIKDMENYGPWHNTYLALYFTLTGLHALHILGGSIVIGYLWGPGRRLWKTDPEHFTNRVEVSGLFWHFVDLVWIFLFPVLYLM